MKNSNVNIAVLGASGIGKNHARWFQSHGARCVAFLGSSAESLARTEALLQNSIGFEGRGYTDLEQLLDEVGPQAVCVATLNHQHYEHSLACIRRGIPVLCEKPLVHTPELTDQENCAMAQELVHQAREAGVLLGTQMQYSLAANPIAELAGVTPQELHHFEMVMETKNLIAGREGRALWIDLAPHPLSLLSALLPGAKLQEVLTFQSRGLVSEARFTLCREDGQVVSATVRTGCVPGAEPTRTVKLNDRVVSYAGFKDADGVFRSRLQGPDGQVIVHEDFVNTLIGNFLRACAGQEILQVTGEDGARNLEWVLKTSAC